jgi:hypothetical protein
MASGKAELAAGLFAPLADKDLDVLVDMLGGVRDRLSRMIAEDLASAGGAAS